MIWLKKYGFTIAIWGVLGLAPFKSMCQKISTDSLLTKAFANDQLLPILIAAAQKNSPEIKRLGSGIEFATANQKISKNAIFERLSLLASYHYGTNYSAINDANSINSFTTVQTGFYNLGVGLQLPVSQILNRKHFAKSTQSQIEMANYEKENTGLYIKQRVIEYYQDLKLSHRLMLISSNNKQAAQVNYKMGERDFLQAQITVDQISRVLDIFNKSKIEYETYLNRFQTSLMQLDAYSGVSFSSLLNQVK
ncbi:MAG: TolC family protein [Bacteroidota bacterium]|jgi:outer membrane protein TolC